jgi:hypothetical protein
MAGRPRSSRKPLVEDCEVIRATDQNLVEYVYGRLRTLRKPMSFNAKRIPRPSLPAPKILLSLVRGLFRG